MKSETFNLGDSVICDLCGQDYTNSKAKGGITFGSKAICPTCTPEMLKNATKYNEESYIKHRCPEDKTFADWVREDLREGKPGHMTITTL